MSGINPAKNKMLAIQMMWFWSLGNSLLLMAVGAIGLVESLPALGELDLASALDTSGTTNTSLLATAILAAFVAFMGLCSSLAVCGFLFIVGSLRLLGTMRGRGFFFFFLAFLSAPIGGVVGVASLGSCLLCGIFHFIGGCCVCRPSASSAGSPGHKASAMSLYDTTEVNPAFTRQTQVLENRVSTMLGMEPIDYDYDYGAEPDYSAYDAGA